MVKAVRTWRSDGSQNVMDLDTAVDNLRSNCVDRNSDDSKVCREATKYIRARLLRGQVLKTEHAEFRVFTGNAE